MAFRNPYLSSLPLQRGGGQEKKKQQYQKTPPKSVYIPKGLRLAKSSVPEAGLGIFAEQDFPKDHDFGPYKGRWLTPEEYENSSKQLLYVWEVNDYVGNPNRPNGTKLDTSAVLGYWDGGPKRESNYMRYINHPRNKREENTIPVQKKDKIHYVSTRPIKANEELFINYGPMYSKYLIGTEELPE